MHLKTNFEMWKIQACPVTRITQKKVTSLDSFETGYRVEEDRGVQNIRMASTICV